MLLTLALFSIVNNSKRVLMLVLSLEVLVVQLLVCSLLRQGTVISFLIVAACALAVSLLLLISSFKSSRKSRTVGVVS